MSTSLSDLEAALLTPPPTKGGKGNCKVRQITESFEEPIHSLMLNAFDGMNDNGEFIWSAPKLVKLLKDKAEITVAATTILRHRNDECNCGKTER